jgi:uncharacterized protein (TIGR00369 family)
MTKSKPAHGHIVRGRKAHPLQNFCFGCGKDNKKGMRLKFYSDEETQRTFSRFTLPRHLQGPPGHAHGGIIATILDEAMGKVNKFRSVVGLTRAMNIEYLKPVPLETELTVTGWEQKVEGREHTNVAEIRDAKDEVLARSTGLFVVVNIGKMFAKHLNNQGSTTAPNPAARARESKHGPGSRGRGKRAKIEAYTQGSGVMKGSREQE